MDWFKEAGMTYRRNFKHPHIEGDITKLEVKQAFYDAVSKQLNGKTLTVLSGGFPCQGFSMAGSRVVEDERNSLYKDMLEIVDELKPEYVVAENVKGLRSMLGGFVEKKIVEDMEVLGYEVNVTVLTAADYFVPQKRERVIFIANRIHSYSIVITDAPLFNKTFKNLKAYATITYSTFSSKVFEMENHFFNFRGKTHKENK